MQLINTIEINPYDYANSEYESPNGSSQDMAEARNRFWQKCISDKNLGHLKPIKTGSYLVDINSIGNTELEEIIKNELKEVDLADYQEQVGVICGGIVIKIEDEIVITPSCCGDIENICEWENIVKETSKDWKQLWIGHPWIFYKKEKGIIEFSDYYESNLEDIKEVKSVLKIQEKDFVAQLRLIKKQQIEFENSIQITLDKLAIKNSKEIAKLMTGNE